MDRTFHDYQSMEVGNDVERTLMMVSSGAVGNQNGMAEVSVITINYALFSLVLMLEKELRTK